MYDCYTAFICDDGFEPSSTGNAHSSTAVVNPVALLEGIVNNNNIRASENPIQHHDSNNHSTTFGEHSSAETNVQGVNPHRKTLVDINSCEQPHSDNAAPGEVHAHRIEPENKDQRKSTEPSLVTSQVIMTENLDFEDLVHVARRDSVCASALGDCSVKAAANSEETASEVVDLVCKAAQDAHGEAEIAEIAENAENDSVEAGFEGENPASDVTGSSPSCRISCRPMRPSRGIHPINNSPPSVSNKPRHALSPQPSRGVQPIMSETFALSVIIKTAQDPQPIPTGVLDPNLSEPSSSESDLTRRPESRKRAAVKQSPEAAKRAKQCDEALISPNLRPRRSTRPSTEGAHYFKYEYESVQRKCNDIQRDIDDLDIHFRREVKELQRRFRKEAQEGEDRLRKQNRDLVEKFQVGVRDLEDRTRLDEEALQRQLDMFKADLKNEGLVDLDA